MLANNHLNALLLADDLVIFSLSKKKTTRKVKLAKKILFSWDLDINTKKTNNIIFNKQEAQSKKSNFTTKTQKLTGLINTNIYYSLLNRLGKNM